MSGDSLSLQKTLVKTSLEWAGGTFRLERNQIPLEWSGGTFPLESIKFPSERNGDSSPLGRSECPLGWIDESFSSTKEHFPLESN